MYHKNGIKLCEDLKCSSKQIIAVNLFLRGYF